MKRSCTLYSTGLASSTQLHTNVQGLIVRPDRYFSRGITYDLPTGVYTTCIKKYFPRKQGYLLFFMMVILTGLSMNSRAQTTLYLYQNFDSVFLNGMLPNGWTQEFVFPSSDTINWKFQDGGFTNDPSDVTTRNPYPAKTGLRNALFAYENYNYVTRLITPKLDLSYASHPKLIFYHAQQAWNKGDGIIDNDELRIDVKKCNTCEWDTIMIYDQPTTLEQGWVLRTIQLPDSEFSSDFYIAFEGKANFGWGVCLDSVVVIDTVKVLRKLESVQILKVSKNPVPQQSVNQPILRIDFYVSGNDSTVTLNSLSAVYTGSPNTIDPNSIKLYQTSDTVFDVANLLGTATFLSDTASFNNLNFQLPSGISSVWITMNINNSAIPGSIVNAEILSNSINVQGSTYPSVVQNPPGFRTVITSIFYDNFDGSVTTPWNCSIGNGWSIGPPHALTVANMIGYPHPAQAYSGTNVLGTNLNSAIYPQGIPDHGWQAISPPGIISARYYKNTILSYEQYLDIDATDNVYLDYSTDSGSTWIQLWHNPSLYVENTWNPVQFNTRNSFDRQNDLMLRYSLGQTASTGWRLSGWCVDDVFITGEYVPYDLALTKILAPLSACGMSDNEHVTIQIKNTGPNPVNQKVPIKCTLNGILSIVDSVNIFNFIPNEDTTLYLSVKFDLSHPGYYSLKCQLLYSKDSDNRNDTLSETIYSIPVYNLPHTDAFESNQSYWSSGALYDTMSGGYFDSWQLEPPDGALIYYPPPGGKYVWWTNRSDGGGAEYSYVESPCYNFSGVINPVFTFKYFCFTDTFIDGSAIYYSIDGGSTWNYFPKDPYSYKWNWYNGNVQMLGNINGFTGLTGSWFTGRQFFPEPVAGQSSVKLRVYFGCYNYEFNDGMAFDDVTVEEAPPDVGVVAVNSLTNACPGINSPNVNFTVKNFGIRTLTPAKDTIIAGIQTNVSGSKKIVDTFYLTQNLIQGDSVLFTFKKPLNIVSIPGNYTIEVFTMIEKDKFFYDSVSNDTLHLNLSIYANPIIDIPDSIHTRQPDTVVLQPVLNNSYSYKWQDNSTDSSYHVLTQGLYTVQVTNNATGCMTTDSTKVILIFYNLALNKIISPRTVCDTISNIHVTVQVKNVGNDTLKVNDSIVMNYEFSNDTVIEDTLILTKMLLPGDTVNFTFMKSVISMPAISSYFMKAYLHFNGDTIRTNDTLAESLIVYGSPTVYIGSDTTIFGFIDTLVAPSGFKTYSWTDLKTNETSDNRIFLAQTPGTCLYLLTVTDYNNCPASDSVSVSLFFLDIGTRSIDSPVSSCSFANPVQLTYTLANMGSDTIQSGENIYIGYRVNGGNWNRDTITLSDNLLPGDSIVYTFTKTENLSSIGSYVYQVYTTITGDIKLSNDTLTKTIYTYGYPVVDLCGGKCTTGNHLSIQALQYTFDAGAGLNDGYLWNNGSGKQTLTATKPGSYIVTVTDTITGCYTTDTAILNLIIIDGLISNVSIQDTMCMNDFDRIAVTFTNKGTTDFAIGDTVWFGYQINFFPPYQVAVVLPILMSPGENFTYTFLNLDSEILTNLNNVAFWTIIAGDMRTSNDSILNNIFVNSSPTPFNLGGSYGVTNDTIVSSGEVELDPGQYAYYLWQYNSTTSETFFATKTGWYSVTVSNDGGCTYTDSIYLNMVKVGLPEYTNIKEQLYIYPDPATTVLTVIFENMVHEDLNIEMISADGKQVYINCRVEPNQSTFNEVFDVNNVPKGMYFIRVYNKNFVQVEKLIIQ